jgi:hypothetical protein
MCYLHAQSENELMLILSYLSYYCGVEATIHSSVTAGFPAAIGPACDIVLALLDCLK